MMLVSADKKWDYAFGMIRVDGLEPSKEFKKFIEKKKRGEMTTKDMRKMLDMKYKMKEQGFYPPTVQKDVMKTKERYGAFCKIH